MARFLKFENTLIPVEKISFVRFDGEDLQVEIRLGDQTHHFMCDAEMYEELVEFLSDGRWPFDLTTIWTDTSSTSH